jgi:hypothetical protein
MPEKASIPDTEFWQPNMVEFLYEGLLLVLTHSVNPLKGCGGVFPPRSS